MWGHISIAVALAVIVVLLVWRLRRRRPSYGFGAPPAKTESWPTLGNLSQLQPGRKVLIGHYVHVIHDFVRLGLTNVAPAYWYTLQDELQTWLFVQVGPSSQEAWLLEEVPWSGEPLPTIDTPEVHFGLGCYGNPVWREVLCYPRDGIASDEAGPMTYALYFQDLSRSIASTTVPGILVFVWRQGRLTVGSGYPVDLRKIKVQ